MTWETRLLRLLLVLIVMVLAVLAGVLFLFSRESARDWPELAHLQLPLYVAMLIGFLPVLAALAVVFRSLRLIDEGARLRAVASQLLPRLRWLAAVFIGYVAFFLAFAWVAIGTMHPTLLFVWFTIEIAAVFVWTLTCLFERRLSDSQPADLQRPDSADSSRARTPT